MSSCPLDVCARYLFRSQTSVYVGLPVIAHSTEKQAGRKWHTFWYRARLDVRCFATFHSPNVPPSRETLT